MQLGGPFAERAVAQPFVGACDYIPFNLRCDRRLCYCSTGSKPTDGPRAPSRRIRLGGEHPGRSRRME